MVKDLTAMFVKNWVRSSLTRLSIFLNKFATARRAFSIPGKSGCVVNLISLSERTMTRYMSHMW